LAALVGLLSPPAAHAATADALKAELERLAAPARGTVGVAAWHVETNRRVFLRGAERFPMASVYKLPVAITILKMVDRGEMRLRDSVEVAPGAWRPGRMMLSSRLAQGPVCVSWLELMRLAIGESDNAAADFLLQQAGGPVAVTRRVRALGIGGLEVNRSEGEIAFQSYGLDSPPPEGTWSAELFERYARNVSRAQARRASDLYDQDVRDTSTPAAAARLLVALARGRALSDSSTSVLVGIMTKGKVGRHRIRGLLPKGTPVADKTGTSGRTTNDVGLITLPDGRGHLAVAVFIKESKVSIASREKVIAQISRALYDAFSR
jgi:beta-lactamase class A